MAYTSVFGGNTIYPSDVSYLSISLAANQTLQWPLENAGGTPLARIIDVSPTAGGFAITLPDATLTSAGQVVLFNNTSGSYSFTVLDAAGGTLATIGYGEQWELYLAATSTVAGTWRVFRFGASTASVQPSALAGFGLTATGTTLSQAMPVSSFNTSLSVAPSNRGTAFVWIAAGTGTLSLPTAASVGNNFFIFVRNSGGGALTIDPAGSEQINSQSALSLQPGDSATVITDGNVWYTIGLGQPSVFAFDYTSISVTGGNYTLSGPELNRIAYRFFGTLTSDCYVIVPATVQQYWVTNATTGAFNLYIRTASGTPLQVVQGAKGIYYCDGSSMVLASDPTNYSLPLTVAQGGTGGTTQSAARLGIGISTFADPVVTATTAAAARTALGAAASGANTDITSLGPITGTTATFSGILTSGSASDYVKCTPDPVVSSLTVRATSGGVGLFSVQQYGVGSGSGNSVLLAGAAMQLGSSSFPKLTIDATGNFWPISNATLSLGASAHGWSVVYAASGTINTSDETQKVWRGPATHAEMAAARAIMQELGFYQWVDAVAKKGPNDARYHYGARAQQVWRIMAEHGLVDPIGPDGKPGRTPYGFLCWDEWGEETEQEIGTRTVLDEEGNEVEEKFLTGNTLVVTEAGSRYGLRPDELALFLLGAMEQRLAALEAA